jgi:hypothetical protein
LSDVGWLPLGAKADEVGVAMNVLLITNEFPNPYEPRRAGFSPPLPGTTG